MSRTREITVEGDELSAKADTENKQWIAVNTGTHSQDNHKRKCLCYQELETSTRDNGSETVEDGAVVEYVDGTHSGKNRSETHYLAGREELHQLGEDDIETALEEIVVGAEEGTHECEGYGDEFGSEHGFAIHRGMVHATAEEEVEDETPAEKTISGQRVVADGGIEYNDYDIDPTELEFDIENGWRDSTNGVSNTLSRIKGSDLWICYRSWQTGPNEFDHSIKGLGEFSVEALELDQEFLVEQIQVGAEGITDAEADSDVAEELKTYAPELAQKVAAEWALGVKEIIGDAAYDGRLGHDGTVAWLSNVEVAHFYETKNAIKDIGIEDTPNGIVHSIVRGALSAAVNKHCDEWRNPLADYLGRLEFEVDPWELRALELYQNGVFRGMIETARVQALRETGKRPSEIADILDVNPSTITRHKNRADEWLDRAKWTVENVIQKETEAAR
ncbi:hypothetical protein ACFQE1_03155 [Halobium palmae]|uniref:HTH luxR-type domain-containing protein n=1 Tax=Halobium palmae TaxID=1776492 RepID=A0ABD5RW18_9EURY